MKKLLLKTDEVLDTILGVIRDFAFALVFLFGTFILLGYGCNKVVLNMEEIRENVIKTNAK